MDEILNLQNKDNSPLPEMEEKPQTFLGKLVHERSVSRLARAEQVLRTLTPGERLMLYVLTVLLAGSALALLIGVNREVSSVVPSRGGTLVEGALGTPRFINPLLAISQVDQDLATLTYSGLMRATPEGDLIPDLAERYDISEDGTVYTFYIRPDATFHDGTPVTADDVVFTVGLAQNPNIKSPKRADWEGVSVSAPEERTVVFVLPSAYAPFLENAQLGILPKNLWENIAAEEFPFHTLNTHPVGSGPYRIQDTTTDDAGAPLSYEFAAFEDFALGAPHLSTIEFKFFSNEDTLLSAFDNKSIDSFAGISPERISLNARPDTHIVRAASTRIFAIFLNQNHAPVLADAAARTALSHAIDRPALIRNVLSGYARPANDPIPPGLLSPQRATSTSADTTNEDTIGQARSILSNGGWVFTDPTATSTGDWTKKGQRLSFALATADTPELVKTAQAVAEEWHKLGVDVTLQVYPLTEFNATVLRPRTYDAVLFGEVVGRTLDLFAFWHSSQRNDPGLNLALYANTRADRALASARVALDKREREKLYHSFSGIVAEDTPAVFLYAPEFLYVAPTKVQNIELGALTAPSERFLSVHTWYTDTERVWDIFTDTFNDTNV